MKKILVLFFVIMITFLVACRKYNYKNIYTIKNESTVFMNLSLYINGSSYDHEVEDGGSIIIQNDNEGNSYLELSDSAYIYFNNYEKLQINSKYTGDVCPGLGTSGNPSWFKMGFYCENFFESEEVDPDDTYTTRYLYVFDTADCCSFARPRKPNTSFTGSRL